MTKKNNPLKKNNQKQLYSGDFLSNRLKSLMSEYKITTGQLSRNTGIPVPTIKRIKNDINANPTINSLVPLAKFFSINVNQLIGLEPLPEDRPFGVYIEKQQYWTQVPIISWQEVIFWPNNQQEKYDNPKLSTISTDIEITEDAFALVVDDDLWQGFLKGSVLIVDPNKPASHKNYVVVCKKSADKSVLYQLLKHDGIVYLKHPCEIYQTFILDQSYKIAGTVVQIRMDT